MIHSGRLFLDDKPRIAAAITDKDMQDGILASGADVLEVRVDEFSNKDVIYVRDQVRRIREAGLPMILTVRNDPAEGARHAMEDPVKYSVFAAVISLVDAVDIELSSPIRVDVIKLARDNGKVVMISKHDFNQTLADEALEAIFISAKATGADIVKIAMQANTQADVRQLTAFTLRHQNDNIIMVSLGQYGAITRLALPAMGSLLSYSYISQSTASGQIPIKTLREDFRRYYLI